MASDRASVTVKVGDDGRVYIPHRTRRALGIHGSEAHVTLDIQVLERLDGGNDDG